MKPLITKPSKTAYVSVGVRCSNTKTQYYLILLLLLLFFIFTYIPHADGVTYTYISHQIDLITTPIYSFYSLNPYSDSLLLSFHPPTQLSRHYLSQTRPNHLCLFSLIYYWKFPCILTMIFFVNSQKKKKNNDDIVHNPRQIMISI